MISPCQSIIKTNSMIFTTMNYLYICFIKWLMYTVCWLLQTVNKKSELDDLEWPWTQTQRSAIVSCPGPCGSNKCWLSSACALAELCQHLLKLHRTTDNSRPLRPCSRSFKVIVFCCNQKPIHDVLLVPPILYHASFPRYSIARSKTTPPYTLSPQIEGLLRILSSNLMAELWHWATFWWKLNDPNCSRFVTIHSRRRQTDRRQTDDIL